MQYYSTPASSQPWQSQVWNLGQPTPNGSGCSLGIPGCSCLSIGMSQGADSQSKPADLFALALLGSLLSQVEKTEASKMSEPLINSVEETSSETTSPVSYKKGDKVRAVIEATVSYDAPATSNGVYVIGDDGSGRSISSFIPRALATTLELVEAVKPAESFVEGAAYIDVFGDVYIRRYESAIEDDGKGPWVDYCGDICAEDEPERPLVKLVKPEA